MLLSNSASAYAAEHTPTINDLAELQKSSTQATGCLIHLKHVYVTIKRESSNTDPTHMIQYHNNPLLLYTRESPIHGLWV